MAGYIEIDGDATKPQFRDGSEIAVIPHVCNNVGAWGAGFVIALNKSLGFGPWGVYKEMEKESPNGLQNRLGEICACQVNNRIHVVNMIAQSGIRNTLNTKPIRYWALLKCMGQVPGYIGSIRPVEKKLVEDINIVIHCPKFGSDLAGGNWDFIKELIMETWVDRGFDVVVYNYVP